LARKSKKVLDGEKVSFVSQWITKHDEETNLIKNKWIDNFVQFTDGSIFHEKQEWQSNFSLGKYEARIRSAAGRSREVILTASDFYDFDPQNPDNELAELLAPIFKKLQDYYLNKAGWKRRASTFLLSSYISMGSIACSWKNCLVRNPEWTTIKTRPQVAQEQKDIADQVQNPQLSIADEINLQDSVEQSFNDFPELISGEEVANPDEDVKPWIQVGCLDLQVINPMDRYWDTNAQYLEESSQGAYKTRMRLWQLKDLAEKGFFDKKKVREIETGRLQEHTRTRNFRFKNLTTDQNSDVVELTIYFGPLIIDGKIKKEAWGCIIANNSTLIKEWDEYPYWEPPTHKLTPFVDSAVKEVPFRPTGAGAGDNAVQMSRELDANMNLANDQMRFNTIGITGVDYSKLVDRGILETGIEPGKIIETIGDPQKAFHHVSLTSNIENQFTPTNQILQQSIDEQMGISEVDLGGQTQRSRVTAQETQVRAQGTQRNVNNIAIDLELTFIIPFLEKVFARILQFALPTITTNPEIKEVLTDEEINILAKLDERQRLGILNNFYRFKIKGFSSEVDKSAKIDDFNDALAIVNSSGPISQMVNLAPLAKQAFEAIGFENVDEFFIPNTPLGQITLENQLLLEDRSVEVQEDDDHELHMQSHMLLLNSPSATPALQEHVQAHQQIFQQIQQAQQQSQGLAEEAPSQNGAGIPPGVFDTLAGQG
jgi:hypothetical protein